MKTFLRGRHLSCELRDEKKLCGGSGKDWSRLKSFEAQTLGQEQMTPGREQGGVCRG